VSLPIPKIDNAKGAKKAKVQLRQHLLEVLGPANTHVFDAFAGAGLLYDAVWHQAATYVGCDSRWHQDARTAYVADNQRVLRAIDLAAFNCFDFDAYGAPWDQLTILAARRPMQPGERLGIVFTEGTWLKTRTGLIPHALRRAAGLKFKTPILSAEGYDELIARALNGVVERLGGTIVRRWRARGLTPARVQYIAVVLERR
jgi:hypothetical protein